MYTDFFFYFRLVYKSTWLYYNAALDESLGDLRQGIYKEYLLNQIQNIVKARKTNCKNISRF